MPDTAIWLVDATDPDHGKASSDGLSSLLATGPLSPKDKLLVVINKTYDDGNTLGEIGFHPGNTSCSNSRDRDLVAAQAEALGKIVDCFGSVDFGTTK